MVSSQNVFCLEYEIPSLGLPRLDWHAFVDQLIPIVGAQVACSLIYCDP